jgi:rubrerythrin
MALINSDACQEACELKSADELARIITSAIADEAGAHSLYSKISESIRLSVEDPKLRKRLIDIIEEIKDDEANHMGKLLHVLSMISTNQFNLISLGENGEDVK